MSGQLIRYAIGCLLVLLSHQATSHNISDNNSSANNSAVRLDENVKCDFAEDADIYERVLQGILEESNSSLVIDGHLSRVETGGNISEGATGYSEAEQKTCPQGADYREILLAQRLLGALPPFVVSSPQVDNQKCLHESKLFRRELTRLSTWALKMHDSSAKLPSGLLNGNVIQYGDFDQCLDVNSGPSDNIRGKYCLAYLDVTVSEDLGHLQDLHKLVQAHGAFRSTLDDPGHRVPRFSSVQWGLCVPSSCQHHDVQLELERVVQSHFSDVGLRARVRVDPNMCLTKPTWTLPGSTIAVGILFLLLACLVTVATLRHGDDTVTPGSRSHQLLRAFSLRKNYDALVNTSPSADDLESVHGIRFFNALMLLICHKSMAVFFDPYVNRTGMAEQVSQYWTVVARAANLYTDPFVMLSGLLTSYSYFKILESKRNINIPQEYASRMFRLVPNLGAVILFCTFILPSLGSGPQWNLVVNHHADLCRSHWWRNLLFIHNYFGFEKMCLTHTHHLGIDTQLFVLAPALVYLLWRWPKAGAVTLATVAAASTYMRYHVAATKHLSLFIYFGTSVSQLFRSADLSYILPSHRLTVYIIGIFLGYALRRCGRQFSLKAIHVVFGWSVTAVLFYTSLLAPARMGLRTYVYDPQDAANYSAFSPIYWCLVFAWIIFATHTGNGGLIGDVLSWPGFKVTTRLSYALYLTQFPVFFYNVGRTRSSLHYSIFTLVSLPETCGIILASVILTLVVDLPFQNLRSILLKKPKTATS